MALRASHFFPQTPHPCVVNRGASGNTGFLPPCLPRCLPRWSKRRHPVLRSCSLAPIAFAPWSLSVAPKVHVLCFSVFFLRHTVTIIFASRADGC